MEAGFGTTPTGLRIIITDMDIHGIGALLTMQLRPSLSLNPTSSLNASRANLVLKAKTASRSSPLSKLYREYSTIWCSMYKVKTQTWMYFVFRTYPVLHLVTKFLFFVIECVFHRGEFWSILAAPRNLISHIWDLRNYLSLCEPVAGEVMGRSLASWRCFK